METAAAWWRNRGLVAVLAVGGLAVVLMAMLVVMGVRRSPPETFVPMREPHPAYGQRVGPTLVTIDASPADRWRFFSFERGAVV